MPPVYASNSNVFLDNFLIVIIVLVFFPVCN
jgi:hypothetical protein